MKYGTLMKRSLTLALLVAIGGWNFPAAAQSRSAADSYRVAASGITSTKDEAERFVLSNVLDAPLDAPAKAIVERYGKSLEMFDVASKLPFGTWGYDLNEPMTAGRLVPNILELADVVILRARLRAAAGDHKLPLEDALHLAQLARRLSVQPSLPRQIQQLTLFDKATQLAGAALLDAAPADITAFVEKLDELRSPPDAIDVIEAEERAYLLYHRRLVDDPYLRRIAEEGIGPFNMLFGKSIQPVNVDDLTGDEPAAIAAFAATEQVFTDVIAALKLPPLERVSELQAARARAKVAHPLAQAAVQIMDECMRLTQIHEMQMTFLRTAATICADPQRPIDADKARALARPMRFDYLPLEAGFSMKFTDQGQLNPPMTIVVGPRPVRVMPATAPSTRPR